MNIDLIILCKIISLVLLLRLNIVVCVHAGSFFNFNTNNSNEEEEYYHNTSRNKKLTKKLKKGRHENSHSSDEDVLDPFLRLFVLDVANTRDTAFTKYRRDTNCNDIYFAKGPFLIMAVRNSEEFIWQATDKKYPSVVVYHKQVNGLRNIEVFYPDHCTGLTEPEDDPKPIKPTITRGYLEYKKQKNHKNKKSKLTHYEQIIPKKNIEKTNKVDNETELETEFESQIQQKSKQEGINNKLIVLDINERHSTKIIKYRWDDSEKTEIFTLEYPYLFSMIQRGEELLWSPEDEYPFEIMIIHGTDGGIKLQGFYPVDEYHPTNQESEPPQPQPLTQPKEISLEPQKQVEHKKPVKLVKLDINDKRTSHLIKYKWDDKTKTDVFITKPPYLLGKIVDAEEVIWKKKSDICPNMVTVTKDTNVKPVLKIYYPNPKSEPTNQESEPPQPQPLTQPKEISLEPQKQVEHKKPVKLVKLDINDKRTSHLIKYKWDDKTKTDVFITKPPYLLGKIVDAEEVIWKKKSDICPNMVTVTKDTNVKPVLKIYYPNPKSEPTNQESEPPQPQPLTQPKEISLEPQKQVEHKKPVKLVKLDINDKRTSHLIKYKWDDKTKTDVFITKPPYLLGKIVDAEEVIWKKKSDICPNMVTVTKDTNVKPVLKIYYPNPKSEPTNQESEPPQPQPLTQPKEISLEPQKQVEHKKPVKLVKLDINDKRTSHLIKYKWDDKTKTDVFIIKPPYLLGKIVDAEEVIWKKKSDICPNMVTVTKDTNVKPVLKIYYPNPKSEPTNQESEPPQPQSFEKILSRYDIDMSKQKIKV